MMSRTDEVEVACKLIRETPLAFLVNDGTQEVWVPKSQADYDSTDEILILPEWLAFEKGLI